VGLLLPYGDSPIIDQYEILDTNYPSFQLLNSSFSLNQVIVKRGNRLFPLRFFRRFH